MFQLKEHQNGEEVQKSSPLSALRRVLALLKWIIAALIVLFCIGVVVALLIFFCSSSKSPESESAKAQPVSGKESKAPETALTQALLREYAFLKEQKKLTDTVTLRYRRICLGLPSGLTAEERAAYELFQGAYAKLRLAAEKDENELMLARYERIANAREREEDAKRKRYSRFLFAPETVKPEKAPAVKKKNPRRISRHAADKAKRKYLSQLHREIAVLYQNIYALTSRRIIVSNVKDKALYASEFAQSIKMLEDWRTKKAQEPRLKKEPYLLPTWKTFDHDVVGRTIELLKHCHAIHELTFNGGNKMNGFRIGRVRVLLTGWKGIDFYDIREKFESRLKITDLNSAMIRLLVAEGARRAGKAGLTFDNIPVLAYYYVLTGSANNVAAMKLGAGEQQLLVAWFKPWGLPQKELTLLQIHTSR